MVHIGLRVKDRGQPGMHTSVEVCISGLPTVIGVSDLTDAKAALNDAETKVVSRCARPPTDTTTAALASPATDAAPKRH